MKAVAAADSRGQLVLKSAALDDVQQLVDIRKQYVRCAGELHGQAGVEHVGAGHALMHESGGFPHMFGHVGQESDDVVLDLRSEEHTSELQSLMRISYAVFCLKKKNNNNTTTHTNNIGIQTHKY